MKSKTWTTLYAKTSSGKTKQWRVWVRNTGKFPEVVVEHGQVESKLQETPVKIKKGKNLGRSNATTPLTQAYAEAESKWNKQLDKNYVEDPSGEGSLLLPMLALNFKKSSHRIEWPVLVQPKLDGCVFRTVTLKTSEGPKTIEEIVENRLELSVLSLNEDSNTLEYKPVTDWFNNGKLRYQDWLEVVPEFGRPIKCTPDHKFLTTVGYKKAEDLDPKQDQLLGSLGGPYRNSLLLGTLLGDSGVIIERRTTGKSYRLYFTHTNESLLKFKTRILGVPGGVKEVTTGYGSKAFRFTSTALTPSDFPITQVYHTGHEKAPRSKKGVLGSRKLLSYKTLRSLLSEEAVSLWIADDGSLRYNNGNEKTPILSLHTQNFSAEQIEEFVTYFDKVWGCRPSINRTRRLERVGNCPGLFLTFSTKDTLFILNTLRDKHCEGVEYKYYFPTEGYVKTAEDEARPVRFHVRRSRRMPPATRYDIEVQDNHNYVANGIVIHNCRTLAHKVSPGKIEYTSRKGKSYYFLDHLTKALDPLMEVGAILDGELFTRDMSFEDIISAVRQQKRRNPNVERIQYWVYDVVLEEKTFRERYELYKSILPSPAKAGAIIPVLCRYAVDEEEMKKIHTGYVTQGFEGTMIRNVKGLYKKEFRSPDLQKYKDFEDAEFEIIGAHEGVGRFERSVTWLCVTESGEEFDVVPKGSMKKRRAWWRNRKKFIGKMLTVQYQKLSEDRKVPVFPTGIAIRNYE